MQLIIIIKLIFIILNIQFIFSNSLILLLLFKILNKNFKVNMFKIISYNIRSIILFKIKF